MNFSEFPNNENPILRIRMHVLYYETIYLFNKILFFIVI